MSLRVLFLIAIGVRFLGGVDAISAEPSVPVALSEMRFDGNEHFSATELRNALAGEADFWVANHARSNFDALAVKVAQLIRLGYRDQGFRDVFVDVGEDDEGQIRCLIREGEQFLCRAIHFSQFDQVDLGRLEKRLTRPFPDSKAIPTLVQIDGRKVVRWVNPQGDEATLNSAVFSSGRPVAFESTDKIGRAVSTALDDLGFPDAFALVRWETNVAELTADLHVELVQPGTPSRINRVVLEGLVRNHRQAVLDYLEIAKDAVFDQRLQQHIHTRVWQSARFSSADLHFNAESGELTIRLDEIPSLPTIDQPLGEVGTILLRARDWISNHARNDIDISFGFEWNDRWSMQLTYSAGGVVAEARQRPEGSTASDEFESKMLFLADSENVVFVHTDLRQKLRLGTQELKGQVLFSTDFSAADEDDQLYRFFFAGNLRSERPNGEPPFIHRWMATPSGWLALMSKNRFRYRLDENSLVIWESEKEENQITIHSETGAISSVDGPVVRMQFASGLYESARQRVMEAIRDKSDAFQNDKPVSSTLSYLLSEPVIRSMASIVGEEHGWERSQWAVAKKLVDNGLLTIPDEVVETFSQEDSADRFSIPMRYDRTAPPSQLLVDMAARLVLKYAPAVLPEEGWPIEVCREGCLIAMRRTEFSAQVINDLLNDPEVGPVGHAAIALMMRFVSEDLQRKFAERGLDQLNVEAFQRDYDLLVALSGQTLLRKTIASIDSLSPDEMQTLLRSIPDLRFQAFLAYVHANRHSESKKDSGALFWICESPLNSLLNSLAR